MRASHPPRGGDAVGATKRGKGTKWMVVVDGQGLPLGSQLTSASPAEVTLAEAPLDAIVASARAGDRRQSLRLRSPALGPARTREGTYLSTPRYPHASQDPS